ncbi:family 1 encapsulin nanocompartment shell protein [Thermosediminibacter litoriperuensis]|uniref:family 1 encapsulin nanocompartment shell protein n=1 Tax=Thermosediminibacter litoriperuensis TaxID=291989 RepID=UPI001478D9C2|nr:family 1 encapsulin nanocompartment shell protein [Thermosediminibacter litoriperuensis]
MNRSQSPLTEGQWELIDRAVVSAAEKHMVGRRFISLYGPLGAGVQHITFNTYAGEFKALIDLSGENGEDVIWTTGKTYKQIPIIYKDFKLDWRDIETSTKFGIPLDTTPAALSAIFVAEAEDELIFNGSQELDISGLLTAPGRTSIATGNWSQEGAAYDDVVRAVEALSSKGFYGPYALVVSPKLYSRLIRAYKNTNYLEIDLIKKLVTGGVFQTPAIKGDRGVLVSTDPEYVDLALAQDLTVAFLETSKMNHYFRVFELVVPRIKVPAAICTLEPAQ